MALAFLLYWVGCFFSLMTRYQFWDISIIGIFQRVSFILAAEGKKNFPKIRKQKK